METRLSGVRLPTIRPTRTTIPAPPWITGRLLDLAAGLDRKSVVYMVSNRAGAEHFSSLLESYFPEYFENGTLRVFHVPGDGM